MTLESITLRRSGQPPLRFQGELLAEADGHSHTGPGQSRWHEIGVWRTAGGAYVLRIAYRSRYEHELDHDIACVCDSARAVAETLRAHDPTERVQGFPEGDHYAERQRRLLLEIRSRFEALVSEVLDSEEFAEEVA